MDGNGPGKTGPAGIRPRIGLLPAFDPAEQSNFLSDTRLLYVPFEYLDALAEAGAETVILPPVFTLPEDQDPPGLLGVQGLLLIGGTTPLDSAIRDQAILPALRELNSDRYTSERYYVQAALRRRLPIFGVCRGMQVLNEILGGTTDVRRLGIDHGHEHYQTEPGHCAVHPIYWESSSWCPMAHVPSPLWVNSFHRQSIADVSPWLQVLARADDGTIECVGTPDDGQFWALGVQFHPEELPANHPSRACYRVFVDRARQFPVE